MHNLQGYPAAHPDSGQRDWKHLTRLSLADPDYGTPGVVDVLLGADVFSRVVLHGRRFGTPGSPSAFKTQFGWVLTGTVGHANRRKCCHFAITGEVHGTIVRILRPDHTVVN